MAKSQDKHSQLTPNNQMPRVTFRLPKSVLDEFDREIEQSDYHNRSEFLRDQCSEFIDSHE